MEPAINTESSAPEATSAAQPRRRGPKTERGKRFSSQNATKHGIFATGFLPGESQEEYQEMREKLSASFPAITQANEVLVDRLAMLLWRHQRLMRVEAAEIAHEQEQFKRKPSLRWNVAVLASKKDLIGKCGLLAAADSENDYAVMAFELDQMRQAIEKSGPDWERDRPTLLEIYSKAVPEGELRVLGPEQEKKEPAGPIADTYRKFMAENKLDTVECREALIADIYLEIDNIWGPWEKKIAERKRREELEQIIAQVPQGQNADKLASYEVRLDNAINRAMRQLMRMQGIQLRMKNQESRMKKQEAT